MVGAHPDDEDTSLLAALARTRGARVAYLSLTRGEGGQNRIGDEIGEELGILRTAELLAARRLDGAAQRFTRAYDFGYSRTAEETFENWPREEVLSDLVWVVRSFRPQVIVSVFGGTDRDGHGHHRAAGRLTAEAYRAAADPKRFPDQLARGREPWTTQKLYVHGRRHPADATLAVPTGSIDPLLGRSPHQLAMQSRSQHRSQSFGTIQPPGAHASWLRLEAHVTEASPGAPLFAGVDTTLVGLADRLPSGRDRAALLHQLERYRDRLHVARARLAAEDPERVVPPLLEAGTALGEARSVLRRVGPTGTSRLDGELARRHDLVARAALIAAGVRLTVRAAEHELVPGQRVRVRAELWNGGRAQVAVRSVELEAPRGWEVSARGGREPFPGRPGPFGGTRSLPVEVPTGTTPDGRVVVPPGAIHRRDFELRVPEQLRPEAPYYLRRHRQDAAYTWPDDPELWSLPFAPPRVHGSAVVGLGSGPSGERPSSPESAPAVRVREPLRYRGLDRTSGEYWREVRVVPTLSLTVRPGLLLVPFRGQRSYDVEVTARSLAPDTTAGRLALELPGGWNVAPKKHAFSLAGEGRDTVVRFRVRPPPAADRDRIRIDAVATLASGRRVDRELRRIEHPHVEPRIRTAPAGLTALRLPLRVAPRRVGFVAGPSGTTATAVERLGLPVERLAPGDLSPSRLEDLDVVVLGTRAYETRRDLREANPMLLDWVRRGGVLIVQYNRYDLIGRTFGPYPLRVDRPPVRVTEEDAAVRFLDPDAPLFTFPNRIDARDFEGWVQERATFVPRSWDGRYRPFLAMSDAGEPEALGSLLVARVEEGLYVHVTLSLFRQLDAGVPGAYRLLANLVSLDPADGSTSTDGG